MKQWIFLSCFFLLLPLYLGAQDIEVKRERVFTGTGLYGFMNGGADLYLEYGVKKLTTCDLVYGKEEYTLDIYEMPTPEDAFGIYSVHTFKCIEADRNGGINCLSTYQLQSVIGNCYVSLVFTSGSEKARADADKIMRQYTTEIEASPISFPQQLTLSKPYSGVLKFLRGSISLSSAQLSLATRLKDIPFTGVWLFPFDEEDNQAIICFENKEHVDIALKKTDKGDILEVGETWLSVKCREVETEGGNYGPFGF